jgi:halimadienyl-diphosphate synthase
MVMTAAARLQVKEFSTAAYRDFHQLLREIGPGWMLPTAYDTAWVARLGEVDEPLSRKALQWITENQLPDGSWGASTPFYYHDRVICTLAAMIALAKHGRRAQDRKQLDRGREALEQIIQRAPQGVMANPHGATIGFELIVPTLVAEAEALGILPPNGGDAISADAASQRAVKLAKLQGHKINRFMSAAHSVEMLGCDKQEMLEVENLLEANGSCACSPSATAYFASQISPGNPDALAYLHRVISREGGIPNFAPFDVFEPAWVLWNFALTDCSDERLLALCQPHLDFLEAAWVPGQGVAAGAGFTSKDSDDTSLTYDVLTRFGRSVDLDAVLSFERNDHFNCFALEADPSLSANVHVLSALRQAGLRAEHPSVQKTLRFLQKMQTVGTFWFDKWHISPYYTTAHTVMACAGYADDLVQNAVEWLLATQGAYGAWGHYVPTAEETAYCLQALVIWRRQGRHVPLEVLRRGVAWLAEHALPPYPALWVGKCLYSPEWVIRSAVLSALTLVAQE